MRTPAWYLIESPPYYYTEPVLDYGQGPTTLERDYLHVYARSAARAKVLALRAWRRFWRGKWRNRPGYVSGENPFTDMKASRVPADELAEFRADRLARSRPRSVVSPE